MKPYYPQLDQLKGLAILLMVMAHTLSWSCPDYSSLSGCLRGLPPEIFNTAFLLKIIYSFHMHLLFFVSGFLLYKLGVKFDNLTVKKQLVKRASRLLVPYLSTGMFVFFLRGYFGYWFFMVLFILDAIALCELFVVEKAKISDKTQLLSHFMVFLMIFILTRLFKNNIPQELPQLSRLATYYLVFMFGFTMHKYSCIETFIMRPSIQLICFLIYVALMLVANYWNLMGILSIVIPIFAISFLYNLFVNKKSKILGIIGKHSMEIYIFHLFFVMAFPEVGVYIMKQSNFPLSITIQLSYSLFVSAIAIGFSIVIGAIVKSNKYLAKIILGV